MILLILSCLLAGCLAQKPHPCSSPPLLTGALSISTQKENLWIYGKYLYDALGERVRVMELGTYENKSFTYDALMLYREGTVYEIYKHNRTCNKKPLKRDFHPMEIPKDASLLGQVILGSSSGPGQGLLVNTWTGDMPDKAGKFLSTVTEFGCIPVTSMVHTDLFGWMMINYFDNVIGILEPGLLNPPDFCLDAEMKANKEEPENFFSLLLNKH
ncbi:ependymin-2-like [Cottoperca gobio]|uniref:Ependymin-2-like n=1 Tax=Cottoperca gobio TaxID=56716 RepID=A0A6J2RNB3_COTGO|nr:ependymin-2-like [Cottoperca gobio]